MADFNAMMGQMVECNCQAATLFSLTKLKIRVQCNFWMFGLYWLANLLS